MIVPEPRFDHILAMSDHIGTFEHAKHSQPRVEHGYCTDDVARVLVAACREERHDDAVVDLARIAYRFLVEAQGVDGTMHNRRASTGRWQDRRGVDDCWGRAMWAFGTASSRAPEEWMRDAAVSSFERGLQQRSPSSRTMAFAALGATEILAARPRHAGARVLLAHAVVAVGRPAADAAWAWPEDRLTYANAVLPETLIAAGAALDRPEILADGLTALRWLLDRETVDGHLSPTGVGGAGPADRAPMFDQQPIEAAAMADACARAYAVTGDEAWRDGLTLSIEWFLGVNDLGAAMCDPDRGAGFDGLTPVGVNLNQGCESTLAFITTLQHASALTAIA